MTVRRESPTGPSGQGQAGPGERGCDHAPGPGPRQQRRALRSVTVTHGRSGPGRRTRGFDGRDWREGRATLASPFERRQAPDTRRPSRRRQRGSRRDRDCVPGRIATELRHPARWITPMTQVETHTEIRPLVADRRTGRRIARNGAWTFTTSPKHYPDGACIT
jgi:hypothetical protein